MSTQNENGESRSTLATGSVTFFIYYPGEPAAGLHAFDDEITISSRSGDFGDVGDFVTHMRKTLQEWYDEATVVEVKPNSVIHPHSVWGYGKCKKLSWVILAQRCIV